MKPVVLRTGRPIPDLLVSHGDFVDWYARCLGWSRQSFVEIDGLGEGVYPDPSGIDGLIITGSVCSVQDREPWSVVATEWVTKVIGAGIPILGICYGHQMLGDILGAPVGLNPRGREIGVSPVTQIGDDPLFQGLAETFSVIQTHVDAVLTCPDEAQVIATNEKTRIQALAHGDLVRGIQWHPEFDDEIITQYVHARAHLIEAESGPLAVKEILANIGPVPSGSIILRNFMSYFLGLTREAP